jgi:3-deoxy-7-phosphoheptulonate synthase
MPFTYRQQIPDVAEITSRLPLSPALLEIKKTRDREIIDIITGQSRKFLLVIGPCSADSEDPVCEYVSRLSRLQEKV